MNPSDDLKRQTGQHFVLGFHSYHLDDNVKALIRDYHVANIILMKRNIQDFEQVVHLVQSLQLFAKESGHQVPLLIGIDQENGLVSAFSSPSTGTQFPGAMALAACGDEAVCMTERVYQAAAQELRLAGIHWTYAPVADVNSDSKNPVIGVRSFGDDPYRVATLTAAALRGLEAGGIAACAKHFPGHGDTAIDSHLALPEITKSEEELKQTELVPFKTLIGAGVPSVMTGHMALPRLTGNDIPSSLSPAVTTGLLRQNLGFSGLVVTDCLEMNAVAMGWGIEEGAVRALQADADVVMICHTFERQKEAIDNVYNAILRDRLDHDALLKSGTRIAAFKERYVGRWESLSFTHDSTLKARWDELKASNLTLSDDAYRRSITVVKDKHHLLPLPRGSRIVLFTPVIESLNKAVDDAEGVLHTKDGRIRNTAGASFLSFARSLEKRASLAVHHVYSADIPSLGVCDGNSVAVFVLRNGDSWQQDSLRAVVVTGTPVIVLSSCAPYDTRIALDPEFDSCAVLASFEYTPNALEATASVIFGETIARGVLPVAV